MINEDLQLIAPHHFGECVQTWLRSQGLELVRAPHLDSEGDLPIYIIGVGNIHLRPDLRPTGS